MSDQIGRVVVSRDKPASAGSFWCTIEKQSYIPEVGSYLVCETSFSGQTCKLLCVIEDVEYSADIASAAVYYGAMMPPSPPPTSPVTIKMVKVRVVASEMEVYAPPEAGSLVRTLDQGDAELLARNIPRRNRILIGFARGSFIPVYMHSEYLLGEQAAHANISGKTGLATKTSYALFLAYNILAWARTNGERVKIVILNVKGGDLMRLHESFEKWEDIFNNIEKWSEIAGVSSNDVKGLLESWKATLGEINPCEFNRSVKYFTYQGDPFDPFMDGYNNVVYFSYGLADITTEELIAALYRPDEEIQERQVNAIYTYMSEAEQSGRRLSFDNLMEDLKKYSTYTPQTIRQDVRGTLFVNLTDWHYLTMGALRRRIAGFLARSTKIVTRNRPNGNPIKFDSLDTNGINVIQIYGLSDQEQRLVVNALLREIREKLEGSRERVKVVVFVDELNKYAPRRYSPIKEQLLEIASRGRYIGLSLVGAQQFASNIDSEIYGNASLKVVGQSDDAEVSSEIYRFLGELRKRATRLRKGQLIVHHPMLFAPIVVEFPPPPHVISLVA
ncbi:MAG: hypothetical protein QXM43_06625 [Desulfurococcaceae archaeon]